MKYLPHISAVSLAVLIVLLTGVDKSTGLSTATAMSEPDSIEAQNQITGDEALLLEDASQGGAALVAAEEEGPRKRRMRSSLGRCPSWSSLGYVGERK